MFTDEVCQQTGGVESLQFFVRVGFGILLSNPSLYFLLNLIQFFPFVLKASWKNKYNYVLYLRGKKKKRQYTPPKNPQNNALSHFTVIFVSVFLHCSQRRHFLCLGRKKIGSVGKDIMIYVSGQHLGRHESLFLSQL